jgi:hypothetical protein
VTLEGKKYPNWVQKLINDLAFGNYEQFEELARNYGLSVHTVYKYSSDDLVKREVERLQAEVTRAHQSRIISLLEDAYKVYEDLLQGADTDATRLKAAETIFKSVGVLVDKQEIKHSGSIDMPTINIVSQGKKD